MIIGFIRNHRLISGLILLGLITALVLTLGLWPQANQPVEPASEGTTLSTDSRTDTGASDTSPGDFFNLTNHQILDDYVGIANQMAISNGLYFMASYDFDMLDGPINANVVDTSPPEVAYPKAGRGYYQASIDDDAVHSSGTAWHYWLTVTTYDNRRYQVDINCDPNLITFYPQIVIQKMTDLLTEN
jgi:hypothetical protein